MRYAGLAAGQTVKECPSVRRRWTADECSNSNTQEGLLEEEGDRNQKWRDRKLYAPVDNKTHQKKNHLDRTEQSRHHTTQQSSKQIIEASRIGEPSEGAEKRIGERRKKNRRVLEAARTGLRTYSKQVSWGKHRQASGITSLALEDTK